MSDTGYLDQVLAEGASKAADIADVTLRNLYQAMGFLKRWELIPQYTNYLWDQKKTETFTIFPYGFIFFECNFIKCFESQNIFISGCTRIEYKI